MRIYRDMAIEFLIAFEKSGIVIALTLSAAHAISALVS